MSCKASWRNIDLVYNVGASAASSIIDRYLKKHSLFEEEAACKVTSALMPTFTKLSEMEAKYKELDDQIKQVSNFNKVASNMCPTRGFLRNACR